MSNGILEWIFLSTACEPHHSIRFDKTPIFLNMGYTQRLSHYMVLHEHFSAKHTLCTKKVNNNLDHKRVIWLCQTYIIVHKIMLKGVLILNCIFHELVFMLHTVRDCNEINSIQNSYASHRFLGLKMDPCYDQCCIIAIYQ